MAVHDVSSNANPFGLAYSDTASQEEEEEEEHSSEKSYGDDDDGTFWSNWFYRGESKVRKGALGMMGCSPTMHG